MLLHLVKKESLLHLLVTLNSRRYFQVLRYRLNCILWPTHTSLGVLLPEDRTSYLHGILRSPSSRSLATSLYLLVRNVWLRRKNMLQNNCFTYLLCNIRLWLKHHDTTRVKTYEEETNTWAVVCHAVVNIRTIASCFIDPIWFYRWPCVC